MSFSRRKGILLPRNAKPHHHKQEKPARIRYSYKIHWIYPMLFAVCIVFFVISYLCQHAKLIRVRYNITKLKQEKARLIKERRTLKLSIEKMTAPERLEKIACGRLKMIHPDKRTILSLRGSTNTAEDYGYETETENR